MTDQFTDINQMQLSALSCHRRIDADQFPIRRETGMGINPPLSFVDRWQVKFREINSFARSDLVKVWCLNSCFGFRVRIVENPLLTRQITDVSTRVQNTTADLTYIATAINIFEQEISPAIIAIPMTRLRENGF